MLATNSAVLISTLFLPCTAAEPADPEPTEVLILGTPHLRAVAGFREDMLDSVLDALEDFDPDAICVEVRISADRIGAVRRPAAGGV